MATLDGNIFREAGELLETKPFSDMNGEELITVKAALIPLGILPEFSDLTTLDGLKGLARLFDEASGGHRRGETSQATIGNREKQANQW